ncbi:TPA: hypothetical protein GF082_18820 [Citrobacter braakii]|nr:hypothetical protein [Citrobacter braakii]
MKLRYFGYVVRNNKEQKEFIYNINNVLSAYCQSDNTLLKNSFVYNKENVYLLKIPTHQNLYFLIKTHNNEIINQINKKTFTVSNIKDKLTDDEKIGFASYVYFDDRNNIFAIANSINSPRVDVLCEYINVLFSKVGLGNYEIEASSLTKNSKKKDLLEMEVINSIYVDVDASKGLGTVIKDYLFSTGTQGIGNFKIVVESTTGNMKDAFSGLMSNFTNEDGVLENINESGLQKIGAKAKQDALRGQLLDYWLDNESGLSDPINPKAKVRTIMEQIERKYDDNLFKDEYYISFVEQKCVKVEPCKQLDVFKKLEAFNLKQVANMPILSNGSRKKLLG